MKRKRNLQHLWICFAMFLFLAVPFNVKAETETTPVSISVKYGQTEARTILDMINEARTDSNYAWYWNKDDTTKTYCENLQPLQYDYDLERAAMQRAAEIAVIYDHRRPDDRDTFTVYGENSVTSYTRMGENIAAGYETAASVNYGWREDDEPYGGQGHRRNMLSDKFNCVGIGHVYYGGTDYWVENFAYRKEVNTTAVSANETEKTLTIPVVTSKITNFDITFDKEEYSLKTGESTSFSISNPEIVVDGHWGYSTYIPVTDTPDLTIDDPAVATLSDTGIINGISEGDTTISASLYGLTSGKTAAVKVHDCKNHWDNGKITVDPTCTETGTKQYTCTICGETRTEEVAASGHDYSTEWTVDKEAGCEAAGSKSHHCTRCDSRRDETEIPAAGHTWNDGAITTKPTCTDDGVKTFTCKSCGKTRTEAVEALGHDYSADWTVDKEAGCETAGSKSHHCARCNSRKDETEIPAAGHTWNDGAITTKPTCTDEGVKTFTCKSCGKTRTEAVEALGHKYKSNWSIDVVATCSTKGSKSHHCTRCDSKIDITEISTTMHSWDKGVVTKPATVKEEGVKTYTCTVCGAERTETIARLPMPTATPVPTAKPVPSVSVGAKITDKTSGNQYKVTSNRSSSRTVAFTGNKAKTSVVIPSTIRINRVTYKVTAISDNALKNNRNLKKVVISTNVTKIGKNAFYGCKNLTSVTIRSSRLTLKNVGSNAFKNTSSKVTVRVPKKQKTLYSQILKKRGINKKAKIKYF